MQAYYQQVWRSQTFLSQCCYCVEKVLRKTKALTCVCGKREFSQYWYQLEICFEKEWKQYGAIRSIILTADESSLESGEGKENLPISYYIFHPVNGFTWASMMQTVDNSSSTVYIISTPAHVFLVWRPRACSPIREWWFNRLRHCNSSATRPTGICVIDLFYVGYIMLLKENGLAILFLSPGN